MRLLDEVVIYDVISNSGSDSLTVIEAVVGVIIVIAVVFIVVTVIKNNKK